MAPICCSKFVARSIYTGTLGAIDLTGFPVQTQHLPKRNDPPNIRDRPLLTVRSGRDYAAFTFVTKLSTSLVSCSACRAKLAAARSTCLAAKPAVFTA